MPETGKIDRVFFEEHIANRLGASREDVSKGPQHGVDFGVIEIGKHALAVASDPISLLPALGFEQAGTFGVRIVLSDVAVSGLAPTHLAVSFALPPEITDEEFAQFWEAVDRECRDLGVQIVTGHTARYEGCQFPWVGHGTAFAVGNPEEIIYPDGAKSGNQILVTNGPAVEASGLFATLFPEQIPVTDETLTTAQKRLKEIGAIRDARTAAKTGGVTAMHDATEGGLLGAFHEMAASAGVQFEIDSTQAPRRPEVTALCDALEMDPWCATTSGTLVLTVAADRVEDAVAALETQGTPVGVVGEVTAGEGVIFDGEVTSPPEGDSSWPVYERLLDNSR